MGNLYYKALSQTNIDTPNLSFETGTLAGWTQYLGGIYYDNGDGQYKYENWRQITSTPNIQIINGFANQQDPVISCWNFPTNPDGITPVRLGVPNNAERSSGNGTAGVAMAERISYTFTVTENTTLFTYKFATVLHVPELGGNGSVHAGEQLPLFSLEIEILDPATGLVTKLPCGFFEVNADIHSSYGLTQVPTNANCPSSIAARDVDEFAYRNWTTGSYNLSEQLGKTITINILVHDCLVNTGNNRIQAGTHSAYGYFWAETRKMELVVKNCGLEDATILAPEGFARYEWSRSDGLSVTTDPSDPRIAIIPQALIKSGVIYSCTLYSEIDDCQPIKLNTELDEVGLNIRFDYENKCSGEVHFTNNTTIDGDRIVSYDWDFGDGSTSALENPIHIYTAPGEYNVSLTITTNLGCEKTYPKRITVRYFPDLKIQGIDSVCVGETFELTVLEAGVGSLFEWSNGSTQQSIKETAVTSGSYTVKVTDPWLCSYQKSFWVHVKPSAGFFIQGNPEICLNDTVRLTARAYATNDTLSFIWNDGTYGAELKAKPLKDGTQYTATGIYANGCHSTKSVTVKVHPLPVIKISGESSICKGESTLLTLEGASTYNWSDLFSGQEREVSPATATIYTVIGVDSNRCSSLPVSKEIRVKDMPVLDVQGDSIVCEGKSVILTAQGASSYVWHDGSNTRTLSRIPTQDTTYWFEGTINGCTARREIPIRLLQLPYVWIGGKTTICKNDTLRLTANGAVTYYWNNGYSGNLLEDIPVFSTRYQLTGVAANGCSATDFADVTVNPLPSLKIDGERNVCYNTSTILKAEGAVDYYWDNGNYGAEISLFINDMTTVSLRGIDMNGCENTTSYTVNSVPLPIVSVLGKTEVCQGESTTLIGNGATSYVWSDGTHSSSLRLTPDSNTDIQLTGITGRCSSTIDIRLTVIVPPTLYISGESEVCPGESFTLQASGAQSYKWNTGDETATITYNSTSTAEYIVKGTNESGCPATGRHTVSVRPVPVIRITKGKQTGCAGQQDTIRLTASGAKSYVWSSEPYNPSIFLHGNTSQLTATIDKGETTVFIEGEDEFGCIGHAQTTVKELPRKDFQFEVLPAFIENGSSTVRFNGISPSNSKWLWTAGDGSLEKEGNNISHYYSPIAADSFIVSIRSIDEFGCEYSGEAKVFTWKDFWAPDAFSPNNDDLNDTFHFYGGEYMDEFTFIIYNRLGQIVFTGRNIKDEWDGTYLGEPCPWGVYGWNVEYKSNFQGISKTGERKGFVTIIR